MGSLPFSSQFEITARHPTMDSINIAVIGADGVGKSAFIQRALRLSRMPNTNITSVPHDVDGIPHVIVLVELDIEVFDDVDPAQPVHWPKQVDGHMVPRMDGALILYDVTNKESIRDLPPTMCKSAVTSHWFARHGFADAIQGRAHAAQTSAGFSLSPSNADHKNLPLIL